jgi:hypothetical protein
MDMENSAGLMGKYTKDIGRMENSKAEELIEAREEWKEKENGLKDVN